MKCILCNHTSKFLDNYKFSIESDKEYFGNLKINLCDECNLGFANPMPTSSKLNEFYKNIYRSGARPHEISDNYDSEYFSDRNLSYFSYLSSFINFEKINNIFDYGAGNGNLGYLIKKKFKHIKLYSIELGLPSKEILQKRGYQLFDKFEDINEKFDLIVSTRAIQQLVNFDIFKLFKNISHKDTYVFLEVPNNDFKSKFLKRPYDTPGLIFFSEKSFTKIKEKYNLDIINLSFSSYSIDQAYKYMEQSKKKLNFDDKTNIWKFKKIIKKFIPRLFFQFKLFLFQKKDKDKLIEEFMLNKSNSWMIKTLFKWKN